MAGMLFTPKSVYRNGHERVICLLDIAHYVRQLLCSVKNTSSYGLIQNRCKYWPSHALFLSE